MRVVIDLQACQTPASKDRGVGRYSSAFAKSIAQRAGSHLDARFCLNGGLDGVKSLAESFGPAVWPRRFSAYDHPSLDLASDSRLAASLGIAEALIRHHWVRLQPDVLHLSHVFEGFAGGSASPSEPPRVSGLLTSATLHDLIPLRFKDNYLIDDSFKQWYMRRAMTLRRFDLLLANSECTRNDAIELLGFAPERVITIHGGVEPQFTPQTVPADEAALFRRRLGLNGRFVLYTGGDDYRKNLPGAVAGYAEVPVEVRRDTQLVIACALSETTRAGLLELAKLARLPKDALLLPGYVSSDDLVRCYRLCDAFMFPSLYEGLGLPVLEAMSCGAAVIGSEGSAIGEIIGRSDALFDPTRPEAIAEALNRVLGDPGFRMALRCHGGNRSKRFTWERAAAVAIDAWSEVGRNLRTARIAVGGGMPRNRLAVFTPVPPARSGIADYNAAFLPFLARHFAIDVFVDASDGTAIVTDEELQASVRIFPHQEFQEVSARYDAVIYDVGNSEFHAYMLDYMRRYPGIVVLHDAYLSGLYGYLESAFGQRHSFGREMLHAHGPRARRYLAPSAKCADPVREAMINLPATRTVIESAIGVISHSPFNLDVARENYPEGFATPYRIIPQMVKTRPLGSDAARRRLKYAIGFAATDFVVCTFGHIVWTKCGDMVLQAFARSRLARERAARLVFVGEFGNDAFGDGLKRAIAEHPMKSQVSVTGYLDESAFTDYLRCADLAVQLRIHSRGGTPKGVLDCLAHGVPVAVNNDASYQDYPDHVVMKLPPEPSADALEAFFDSISDTPDRLDAYASRGRDFVTRLHAPERVAEQYASAIHEFVQRADALATAGVVRAVARAVSEDPATLGARAELAGEAMHRSLETQLYAPQRILIDVTHLASGDHRTGIQRVVRNIVRGLYCSRRAGFIPIAVRLHGTGLVAANDWLRGEGLLLDAERDLPEIEIDPRWGDCLLMLDSSWERYSEFVSVFEGIRRARGSVYTVVYDLLPIRFPTYWPDGASDWFEGWLKKAVAASDGLICISRAVADELSQYLDDHHELPSRVRRLGCWHLGSDGLPPIIAAQPPSRRVAAAMSAASTFLMVGTLEPRKNHALAISAMERLWKRGSEARLCIAGKQGWLVESLIERIRGHPELGRRLHYIEQPDDEELAVCYGRCTALLMLSAGEGFGLPLVEAARCGTPVIATDLPVFREVMGDHATYLPLGEPEALAELLDTWLGVHRAGERLPPNQVTTLTWDESADQLLQVIMDGRWYERCAIGPAATTGGT